MKAKVVQTWHEPQEQGPQSGGPIRSQAYSIGQYRQDQPCQVNHAACNGGQDCGEMIC
jgi:hypothetical protein